MDDVERMQSNIEKIIEWQTQNDMVFNTKKIKVIQVGRNEELKNNYNYENDIKESPIIPTDEARDLGITISNEGNFNKHIDDVIKKVN